MKHITQKDFLEMPWKNGGGITKEIFRIPYEDDFLLRVSMAHVEKSGPFSVYPGVHRLLKVLSGAGCELKFDHQKKILTPHDLCFSFEGETKIQCDLIQDSMTDFNVMIRRDWGKASFQEITFQNPETLKCEKNLLLIFEPKTQNFWIMEKEEVLELNPGHFFRIDITYLTV